jgi:ABC-type uncharacterized transport system permease subunit
MSLLALLGVLSGAIFSGASLLYATLGEVVGQRGGIVNLGLEGVMLISAATGFGVTAATGNPLLGILAAMLAGGLTNLLFGYLVITRRANQLASGLATMFFGFGLSALIGAPYVGQAIPTLPRLPLPGVELLPRQYTALLQFDALIYLAPWARTPTQPTPLAVTPICCATRRCSWLAPWPGWPPPTCPSSTPARGRSS